MSGQAPAKIQDYLLSNLENIFIVTEVVWLFYTSIKTQAAIFTQKAISPSIFVTVKCPTDSAQHLAAKEYL